MRHIQIVWDMDDDLDGNVEHVAQHGLSPDEVDSVLRDPRDSGVSDSTGMPMVFGYTNTGKYIAVVFEETERGIVYPLTAYEVPEP